jgi:hypothetical protein
MRTALVVLLLGCGGPVVMVDSGTEDAGSDAGPRTDKVRVDFIYRANVDGGCAVDCRLSAVFDAGVDVARVRAAYNSTLSGVHCVVVEFGPAIVQIDCRDEFCAGTACCSSFPQGALFNACRWVPP